MKKIDVSNPLALSKIIASEGLTNQIPADASSVAEQYNASQDVGFPEVTMKPVEIGGEAPDGRDFNGFLQLLSSHLFASQNGGIYTFNADVSSAIGGYPQGAILGYIDTNGDYNFVKSLIDDNTYNFVTNPEYIDNTHWERIVYPGAANTDLSNLTSTGKNIANWSSNVTNCITEIPQDIKLELNNGTLTLKAGSKTYDGNGLFKEISGDKTKTASQNDQLYIVIDNSGDMILCFMGDSVASLPSPSTSYKVYYNTTDKKCYVDYGSWYECSFPIALITSTTSGITSIDQVFNGFGYIGSTVFALPGVKGLIPNGRNADGSLKSIAFTTSSVHTTTTYTQYNDYKLALNASRVDIYVSYPVDRLEYKERENINYNNNSGVVEHIAHVGFISCDGTRITSFKPKTVFHAVDYSDFQALNDDVVHKSGNEYIEDVKTFVGKLGASSRLQIKNNNYSENDSVSVDSDNGSSVVFLDKNNNAYTVFQSWIRNGINVAQINILRNGRWSNVPLGIAITDNGIANGFCPNPLSIANGNEIATCSWVKQYLQMVNVLPANPDSNVFYAIPE